MIRIPCPNCGPRNVSEFRYGGEYNPRPADPTAVPESEWVRYHYFKNNTMGEQVEWWLHQSGCELWFLVERERRTNDIIKSYLWADGDSR
jgi:sarcosine oxidase subunit delta